MNRGGRDLELHDSHRSTRSVLEYLQNTAKGCVRLGIERFYPLETERMVPWPQAALGHTPTLILSPHLQ